MATALLCVVHAPHARAGAEPVLEAPAEAPSEVGERVAPTTGQNEKDADASFLAGRALLKDKRYADACPQFELSQRQDPAAGTLLALAYCQELSGLLSTAWSSYLAAAQLAEREGQEKKQIAASERARALSARLSKLTVVVPAELLGLAGFHVQRDGLELERASFGVPLPMDGGTHSFRATAPGRAPWTSTVTLLTEGDQKTLVLPVLDVLSVPVASDTKPASTPLPLAERPREIAFKRASVILAAASVVGVGVGTAFALSAVSRKDESNADGHCDASGCDTRGTELRNGALDAARAATWSFVASGVLAAASVTLYVTAGSGGPSTRASTRLAPRPSLGAPGLSIAGSF